MKSAQIVRWVLKPAVFMAALVPFTLLAWDAANGALGTNPVEQITHRTGRWGLRFLLITLAVTPIRHLTGWNDIVRFRRMLGLFAFFYAGLHLTTYIWIDQYFDFSAMVDDIAKRPYITVGFTSFLLLVPLAATSTRGMMKRLGGKRWKRLHQLVYVAAVGGTLHYLWLVKADVRDPLIYLTLLAALFALRLPALRRRHPRRRSLTPVSEP